MFDGSNERNNLSSTRVFGVFNGSYERNDLLSIRVFGVFDGLDKG